MDASSSFAPADREKCREDAAALADVLATDDLPLVRMDAALLLAAPIQAGDGVVQRLAGDDDPDVSEAGFNALKARGERACATTRRAPLLRVAITVAMDLNRSLFEPAEGVDVEVGAWRRRGCLPRRSWASTRISPMRCSRSSQEGRRVFQLTRGDTRIEEGPIRGPPVVLFARESFLHAVTHQIVTI